MKPEVTISLEEYENLKTIRDNKHVYTRTHVGHGLCTRVNIYSDEDIRREFEKIDALIKENKRLNKLLRTPYLFRWIKELWLKK